MLVLVLAASKSMFRMPSCQSLVGLSIALLSQLALSLGAGGDGAGGNRLASIVGYAILTPICLVIISQWRQEQERYAVKVYIVASSVMSLFGFAAWLMVGLDWVLHERIDPAHFIDLEQFTDGKMSRITEGAVEQVNEFGVDENTFSFPYSLGLVLVNSYLYELAGIQFFRASGWYNEPVAVWFMVIPALILTCSNLYFSKITRIILLVTQFLFLFASFSVAIISGLMAVYVFRKLLYVFISGISLKFVAMSIVTATAFGFLGVYAFEYVPDSSLAMNIVLSKFSANDYTSVALDTMIDPVLGVAYVYFFAVAFAYSWRAAKKDDHVLMSFSLVVLCFLLVSLKGAFLHLLISPGFFILFALMVKHCDSSPSMRRLTFPQEATAAQS